MTSLGLSELNGAKCCISIRMDICRCVCMRIQNISWPDSSVRVFALSNILRLRRFGGIIADYDFKCIFINENDIISITIFCSREPISQ